MIIVIIIIILPNKAVTSLHPSYFLQSLFCRNFFFRLLILVPFVIRSEITPKETGFIFAREEEEEWNWVIFFSRLWKLKYFGPKRSEIFMIQHPALQTISEVEKDFIYLISVCIGNYYCYYYYYYYFVLFFLITLAIFTNLCFAGSIFIWFHSSNDQDTELGNFTYFKR